jgi:hypothetical protein
MDVKITLSFDSEVVKQAKAYAASQNISLSRLTEFLLRQATNKNYQQLEDMPIAEWVKEIAEGRAEYSRKPKSRKSLKSEFFDHKK